MKKTKTSAKSGRAAVIEVLNKARGDELAAIMQYMAQHYKLDDSDYGEVAVQIKLIAIDEMRHAEMFAERIYELGGTPVAAPSMPAKKGQKIKETFELDVKLETQTVEDYNRFIKVCQDNHDSTSAKLFEQITEEEEVHLGYFENTLTHITELGTAYLAKIAGGSAEAGTGPAKGFIASKGGA